MKKILIYIIALCMIFSLVACNPKNDEYDLATDIDYTSDFVVSNEIFLDSDKAEKSKFQCEMHLNTVTLKEEIVNGVVTGGKVVGSKSKISKIPLSTIESGILELEIINNNDEIFLVYDGAWKYQKIVNNKYEDIKEEWGNGTCSPNYSHFEPIDLKEQLGTVEKGKYRIISPTLYIAKEINDELQAFTYKNENAFLLYTDFEIT